MNHVILIILIFFSIQTFAQQRIDKPNLQFEKSSQIMKQADGWCLNAYGKWIKNSNLVCAMVAKTSAEKSVLSCDEHQSFIDAQNKIITYDSVTYNILIIRRYIGHYKYQTIEQGFYTSIQTEGYIFSKEEFAKLENLTDSVKCQYIGKVDCECTSNEFIRLLENKLSSNDDSYQFCYFPVRKSTEGKIRFYIPDCFLGRNILHPDPNFNQSYFETDINNFNKLFLFK